MDQDWAVNKMKVALAFLCGVECSEWVTYFLILSCWVQSGGSQPHMTERPFFSFKFEIITDLQKIVLIVQRVPVYHSPSLPQGVRWPIDDSWKCVALATQHHRQHCKMVTSSYTVLGSLCSIYLITIFLKYWVLLKRWKKNSVFMCKTYLSSRLRNLWISDLQKLKTIPSWRLSRYCRMSSIPDLCH